jgi:hypothetical protein
MHKISGSGDHFEFALMLNNQENFVALQSDFKHFSFDKEYSPSATAIYNNTQMRGLYQHLNRVTQCSSYLKCYSSSYLETV